MSKELDLRAHTISFDLATTTGYVENDKMACLFFSPPSKVEAFLSVLICTSRKILDQLRSSRRKLVCFVVLERENICKELFAHLCRILSTDHQKKNNNEVMITNTT